MEKLKNTDKKVLAQRERLKRPPMKRKLSFLTCDSKTWSGLSGGQLHLESEEGIGIIVLF